MGSTNHNQTSKVELFANLCSLLMLINCSQVVVRSANVIITSEVSEWLECFLVNNHSFFIHKTLKTINETNEFNVSSLLLES